MLILCSNAKNVNYGDWYIVRQNSRKVREVQEALADCVFTCGSPIEDLEVDNVTDVYTRPLHVAAMIWWKSSTTVLGIPTAVFTMEMNVLVTRSQYYPLCKQHTDSGKSPVN